MRDINFFEKKLIKINKLFPNLKFKQNNFIKNIRIIAKAKKGDLTFLESAKYKHLAVSTKASYCLTNKNLEKFLPSSVEKIIVDRIQLGEPDDSGRRKPEKKKGTEFEVKADLVI